MTRVKSHCLLDRPTMPQGAALKRDNYLLSRCVMTGRLWFTIYAIVPETMGARGCSFDNSERILNDNRGNTEGTRLILYVRAGRRPRCSRRKTGNQQASVECLAYQRSLPGRSGTQSVNSADAHKPAVNAEEIVSTPKTGD